MIVVVFCISDGKEYALKLIEGTGISMSACREIAVSITVELIYALHLSGKSSNLFLNVLKTTQICREILKIL